MCPRHPITYAVYTKHNRVRVSVSVSMCMCMCVFVCACACVCACSVFGSLPHATHLIPYCISILVDKSSGFLVGKSPVTSQSFVAKRLMIWNFLAAHSSVLCFPLSLPCSQIITRKISTKSPVTYDIHAENSHGNPFLFVQP